MAETPATNGETENTQNANQQNGEEPQVKEMRAIVLTGFGGKRIAFLVIHLLS